MFKEQRFYNILFCLSILLLCNETPLFAANCLSAPAEMKIVKEIDRDGDKKLNDNDNCPNTINTDQADTNKDGIGDACDADSDGVPDQCDNCKDSANQGQEDLDSNGVGDACDVVATDVKKITKSEKKESTPKKEKKVGVQKNEPQKDSEKKPDEITNQPKDPDKNPVVKTSKQKETKEINDYSEFED